MIIKIPTWRCGACGYSQDYDPTNVMLHAMHHPGVPTGNCPACHQGLTPDRSKRITALHREADPSKKCQVTVMEEADVDAMEVPDEAHPDRHRTLTAAEKAQARQDIRDAHTYWRERECKFVG